MGDDCYCATGGSRARVYTPERRLIAVGTLLVGKDCRGTFRPDKEFLPPTFQLDLNRQALMFAEAGTRQFELRNWRVGKYFLGMKEMHFEFEAVCAVGGEAVTGSATSEASSC